MKLAHKSLENDWKLDIWSEEEIQDFLIESVIETSSNCECRFTFFWFFLSLFKNWDMHSHHWDKLNISSNLLYSVTSFFFKWVKSLKDQMMMQQLKIWLTSSIYIEAQSDTIIIVTDETSQHCLLSDSEDWDLSLIQIWFLQIVELHY